MINTAIITLRSRKYNNVSREVNADFSKLKFHKLKFKLRSWNYADDVFGILQGLDDILWVQKWDCGQTNWNDQHFLNFGNTQIASLTREIGTNDFYCCISYHLLYQARTSPDLESIIAFSLIRCRIKISQMEFLTVLWTFCTFPKCPGNPFDSARI